MAVATLSDIAPRLAVLDLLRGVAVLGILIVNIWAFALPAAAYDNPAAYGDLTGSNFVAWWFAAVFAQEKFITLFSVLFGAGMALFKNKFEQQLQPSAWLHYRRMFSLLVFGVLHAYLLWFGDILAIYAVCGMLLYPLLRLSTRWLLLIALGLLVWEYGVLLSITLELHSLPASALLMMQQDWLPAPATLADEIAAYRSGWLAQMAQRIPEAWHGESGVFLFYGPRLCAQMVLGVVLFRSGILLAARPVSFYWRWGAFCLALGLALVVIGVQRFVAAQFAFSESVLMGNYWNSFGSLLMAAGYAALIIAWSKREQPGLLRRALQATGRMAFSNYLLTTLLCTTLFYGHGFGWFGMIERDGLLLLTLLIWCVLLLLSTLWLQRFQMGPMEWCWRWLSYGRRPSLTQTDSSPPHSTQSSWSSRANQNER